MSTDPTRPDAASIERGRQIAESMMDDAGASYRRLLAEERSEPPRPPAESNGDGPAAPESGTGEAGPETSAQADALRHAANSINAIALYMPGKHPEFVRGVRYAATLLGHTADDLTEGATS